MISGYRMMQPAAAANIQTTGWGVVPSVATNGAAGGATSPPMMYATMPQFQTQ